jgi:3,4-dihydroxy 2-butanone 4-phosphate synthase / GTP cyclohydrolase II
LICHTEAAQDIADNIDWMLSGRQRQLSQDAVYKQVGTGAQILRDIGVRKMHLMSAPLKFSAISGFDLEVVDVIARPQ